MQEGRLSPVFFGSALTNFGVEPFLESFLRMTTPPLSRESDEGVIDAFSPDFSAFVFKIQANMNKAQRTGWPLCVSAPASLSGTRSIIMCKAAKKMRLSQPQTMMAAEREIVDEAYAGDIIGVFDPGIFSIGDTITVPGRKFRYSGIPSFEPELFRAVSPKDTMKRKQFIKGVDADCSGGARFRFQVPRQRL